ncbi:MAG: 3'-5' exonuclease [Rubrivivax sp.]
MALFPQGLTNVDERCNAGERRVLQQLARLDDDYLVRHDVPVGRARQPDFVILSPRQGILLLEVKDWRRSTIVAATRDRVELQTAHGRVTEAHPLRQARDFALELVDVMQRDAALVHGEGPFRGKLLFPYGFGVVFSRLTEAEVAGTDFGEVFPPHQVLLRNDLDEGIDGGAFQKRLWGLSHGVVPAHADAAAARPHPLAPVPGDSRCTAGRARPRRRRRLGRRRAGLARPDAGDGSAAGADRAHAGHRHRVIHGAAGSGKTMILIYRAQHLAAAARPGQPVLVLCFNRSLADRIAHQLRQRGVDERVQVRTFHSWCADMVASYQLQVPGGPQVSREERFRRLVQTVERALETGFVPGGQYTALLVDEAHDFEEAWLRMAVRLVDPASNSLLVLYDDAQSIYQKARRKFSFASVGIEARGRTSILRMNYRNTAEVLALAMQCAQGVLEGVGGANATPRDDAEIPLVQPASAGRRGPLPLLVQARDARDEAALVAERIERAHAEGRLLSDIAVLCRARHLMGPIQAALARRRVAVQSMNAGDFRRFDWRQPSVKLLTMHSAKGLEFPLVFVAGLQAMPMRGQPPEDEARLLYVAMTRATHELVLSAHGESAAVARVREALLDVARRFAPAGV